MNIKGGIRNVDDIRVDVVVAVTAAVVVRQK